jgi:hypothetical protein
MHKHHIIPTYRGGSDDPVNLVAVSVTQHAMFHFCNWQLWGDKRDWLAWKGLIGEIGKEEIVRELRREGGRKGAQVLSTRGKTPAQITAAQKTIRLATRAANKPEALRKRKESLKRGIAALTLEEKRIRFSREQTDEVLRAKSDRLRLFKSLTVQTPEGVIEVEGSRREIALQLGIEEKSVHPLIRKGKLKKLGFFVISKNPW